MTSLLSYATYFLSVHQSQLTRYPLYLSPGLSVRRTRYPITLLFYPIVVGHVKLFSISPSDMSHYYNTTLFRSFFAIFSRRFSIKKSFGDIHKYQIFHKKTFHEIITKIFFTNYFNISLSCRSGTTLFLATALRNHNRIVY